MQEKPNNNLSAFEVKDVAFANYCLNLIAPFNGLTGIVSIVLAYLKRNDADDTIYESHYTYQIRTFWLGLIGSILSIPLIFVFFIGFLTLGIISVWWMVRNIVGLKTLYDGKPIPNPETYFI